MDRSEIRKEQEQIRSDLLDVSRSILANAALQLMEEGYFDPCVAVLYPDERVEFLYPRYKNADQRDEAFSKTNQYITETGAVGAVLVMETWFTPKGETVQKEALLVLRQAFGFSELEAFPFERDAEGHGLITEKITSRPEKNGLLFAFSVGDVS